MGGGFQQARRRQQHQHARQQQETPANSRSTLLQILPLIILFAFSFLSSLPSLFTTAPPSFAFSKTHSLSLQRETPRLKVSYYVSPNEFNQHPIWEGTTPNHSGHVPAKVKKFELDVEQSYLSSLRYHCSRLMEDRDRRLEQYSGLFFGLGRNEEMLKKIAAEKYESCELYSGYQKQGLI